MRPLPADKRAAQSVTQSWFLVGNKKSTKQASHDLGEPFTDFNRVRKFIQQSHHAAGISMSLPGGIKSTILCGRGMKFILLVAVGTTRVKKRNRAMCTLLKSVLRPPDDVTEKYLTYGGPVLIWIERNLGHVEPVCGGMETVEVGADDNLGDAILRLIAISNRNMAKEAEVLVDMGCDVQQLVAENTNLGRIEYLVHNTTGGTVGEPQVRRRIKLSLSLSLSLCVCVYLSIVRISLLSLSHTISHRLSHTFPLSLSYTHSFSNSISLSPLMLIHSCDRVGFGGSCYYRTSLEFIGECLWIMHEDRQDEVM
jgi:hypothetical protein